MMGTLRYFAYFLTMIGTNGHEGSLFYTLTFLLLLPKFDEVVYKSVLKVAFPKVPLDEILEQYPPSKYENLNDALIDIHTDVLWYDIAF